MNDEPLTQAEQFALQWLGLCKLWALDPLTASMFDFKRKDDEG